jgi:hypothetical protein
VTSAKATHVASAKATHVASAKAAHVASTKAAPATVSSATTAAAGLCTRGKKAAGKHCACQNHHHSSSHDILHSDGRTFRHRVGSDVDVPRQSKANVAMHWRWHFLSAVSIKFSFNHPDRIPGQREPKAGAHQIDNQVSNEGNCARCLSHAILDHVAIVSWKLCGLTISETMFRPTTNPTLVRCRTVESAMRVFARSTGWVRETQLSTTPMMLAC